jgi:microsomal dipeptidase-like Zn-dependent dipeptidase
LLDQKTGVNTGITPLGWKVIEKLLSKRIYIDIKHMSRQSRREYYKLLAKPEYRNIPLIVSHGAVNGRPTIQNNEEHDEENDKFNGGDINFYDDEIVLLAQSNGLFCIQLDERRVVSKSERIKTNDIILPKKKLEARAGFIWNQIEHIARVLDSAQLNAWDSMCIGSDYDGIVDPLNGFWTAKEFKKLRFYLLKHAESFATSANFQFKNPANIISPQAIIDKIFYENSLNFLKNFYN